MDFTTSFITKEELPLVIESTKEMPLEEFLNLLKENNQFFKNSLLSYGGLLFRNFPINNEKDFSALIKALGLGQNLNYIGGDSPRNKIYDGIYTSTEAPPSVKIPLHNELSFVDNYPKHIYFYCQIPPVEKGETIIGDARQIYRSIKKSVKDRFMEKGLKYVSHYFYKNNFMSFITQNSHKSWINVFETEDKDEVERLCKANNFEFQWLKNDWLKLSQTRPATIKHPITNDNIWFNQSHLYDFNPKLLGWFKYLGTQIVYSRKGTKLHEVYFADGSPIPREDLYHILDVLDANTLAFPWKRGDVLVLDNVLAMHGRAIFSGKRRILTAMTG